MAASPRVRWFPSALIVCTLPVYTMIGGALISCRSSKPASPETARSEDQISVDMFRELIAKGALRPVEAMDGEEAFKDPHPDTEGDAFANAEKKLADAEKKKAAGAAEPGAGPPTAPAEAENPYLVFGKRITVYPNGLIMKPYPLRVGSGAKLQALIQTYGNFPLWTKEAGDQTLKQVRMELLEKWDQEIFTDLRGAVPDMGKAAVTVDVADWLVITTGPDLLKEVESFINIFAAGVPQIEIEAKIVEVVTTDTLDLGIKPVDATTPIFGFPDNTFVHSFNYNLPNSASAVNSLLQLGGVQDGLAFNAILQALATYENVSIISRPKIAVREGGKADIVNTLKIPVYAISGISSDGKFSAGLQYEEVGIKLYVVPRVVGTQTVALNIDVEASSQSGTAVTFAVANGPVLSNPIISKRAAHTVVYLEPGQAVILGGLITDRTVDTVNKVPILGDLPILGYFFRSTLKKKEQTHVLFFIRPRILQGSDLNREF